MQNVDIVVPFYPWLNYYFPLFLKLTNDEINANWKKKFMLI